MSDGIQKKVTDRNYVIPIVGVGKIPQKASVADANFVVVLKVLTLV